MADTRLTTHNLSGGLRTHLAQGCEDLTESRTVCGDTRVIQDCLCALSENIMSPPPLKPTEKDVFIKVATGVQADMGGPLFPLRNRKSLLYTKMDTY